MILLTGASGFLGKTIKSIILDQEIVSLGRDHTSLVKCDLSNEMPKLPLVDVVIHAAGKAHSLPKTEEEKNSFHIVNVIGTKNLLLGLEKAGKLPKAFVFISSVAVYGKESGKELTETTPLLAKDAYGKSKIEAEKLVEDWCGNNGVICTIFRLPLIAGTNPPGNLKSMINGIDKGYYFNIDGGKAKKSIVLADDVAKIILHASRIGGIFNLTDRYHPTFLELSHVIGHQLGKSESLNIPLWLAKIMGITGDLFGNKSPINSRKLLKITSDLTFDDSKAVSLLNWHPSPVLQGFKVN